MHIAIVGAGGIGGYFGARWIEAGAQVSFVARGAHGAAIREHGLRVTSALGDAKVRAHAVAADPAEIGAADLVVFAVKLPDAQNAAAQLRPLLRPDTVVLPLQNGVDVVDLLSAQVGAAAVAVGENPELRRLLRQVMSETAALARAEGVPLDEAFVDAQMAGADKLPAHVKALMLGDMQAGKPLELPWLAGAVVRRSERHGLKAEANRFVAAALAPYVDGALKA